MGRTIAYHFFHSNKADENKSNKNSIFYFENIPINVDKIYRSINIELEHECNAINTFQPQRFPQIIVLDKFLDELKHYITTSERYISVKYDINYNNDIPSLMDLIKSHKNFMHYFHIPKEKDGRWFCEGRFFTFDELDGKDRRIRKSIIEFINKKEINYDDFFEEWVGLIFHLAAEYLLLIKRLKTIFFSCDKCHRPGVFIKDKLSDDKDDPDKILGTINVVDTIIYNSIKNLNLTAPIKERNKNNIILYDESYTPENKDIMEEYENFRDETDGAFIITTNEIKLENLIKEINRNEIKYKFLLIIKGRTVEELLTKMNKQKFDDCFDSICLYKHPEENNNDPKTNILYNYIQPDELKKLNHFSDIYPTFKLVSFKEYNNKYISLHNLISSHYGQNKGNHFKMEMSYLQQFLLWNPKLKAHSKGNELNIQTLIDTLEQFKEIDGNEEKIIKLYTLNEGSYYQDFNNWLNDLDPLAIQKTSWFIAAVIYCLNSYASKNNKGIKKDGLKLYRGLFLNFSDLLSYERLKGELICYPSFTSTSKKLEVAKIFAMNHKDEEKYETIIKINYLYKKGFIPTAVDVSKISKYKEEEECLFFPYTFFRIKSININYNQKTAEIELDSIGRKEIIETKLKDRYKLEYNEGGFMDIVAKKVR